MFSLPSVRLVCTTSADVIMCVGSAKRLASTTIPASGRIKSSVVSPLTLPGLYTAVLLPLTYHANTIYNGQARYGVMSRGQLFTCLDCAGHG